jgi:hypothetical protein
MLILPNMVGSCSTYLNIAKVKEGQRARAIHISSHGQSHGTKLAFTVWAYPDLSPNCWLILPVSWSAIGGYHHVMFTGCSIIYPVDSNFTTLAKFHTSPT